MRVPREADQNPQEPAGASWLQDGGQIGVLMRSEAWSSSLGPVAMWPSALRTALGICLGSRLPAVLFWGAELVILYNDAFRSLVGEKHPSLLGQPAPDAEPGEALLPLLRGVMETGQGTVSVEQVLPLRQRGSMTFELGPVRDETGRVTGVLCIGVATPVAQILQQIPVPITVYEMPDHRIVVANESYKEVIRGREIVGKALMEALPDIPVVSTASILDQVARTREPRIRAEHQVMLPGRDGRPEARFFTSIFQPLVDEDGRVRLIAAASIEVTQEVRAREALQASLRFAEEFVGMLGHDLRNPLNAISMSAAVLEQRGTTADRKTLERIRGSSARMARMIDQLLDLTRGRLGGGIQVERAPMDLVAVVATATDELSVANAQRVLRLELPSALRGVWDADRLAQVVSNLVGNAIEHGAPDQPVTVSLSSSPQEAVLTVHSQGTPIPAELLPILFDPFRRGAASAKARGLGLGLYITHEIVRAHAGSVRVTSTATDGTTFVVTLPRE